MQRLQVFLVGPAVAILGIFISLLPARAQTETVIISDIAASPAATSASITWTTDITATGTLAYGTESGSYTDEATTSAGITHDVTLTGLTEETTYYFKISVTGIDEESTGESDEQSFTTDASDLQVKNVRVVTKGSDKIIVEVTLNQGAKASLAYGSAEDSLTISAKQLIVTSGTGATTWPFALTNLKANTTYYYQVTATQSEFWHGKDATATSTVQSAKTSKKPRITGIKPQSGRNGTRVVISGENFGSAPKSGETTGIIAIGCTLGSWPASTPNCMTRAKDIVSWSNTKIVFKVNKKMSTGRVYVGKAYQTTFSSELLYAIRGPKFVVY